MIDKLKSGNLTPDEAAKTLDEVARSIEPASPYGKASDFLKQAAQHLRADEKAGRRPIPRLRLQGTGESHVRNGRCRALSASLAALAKSGDLPWASAAASQRRRQRQAQSGRRPQSGRRRLDPGRFRIFILK